MSAGPQLHPSERVWARLARPINSLRAAEALLGLSPAAARLLAAALHTSSAEVDDLLQHLPLLIRSLSVSTTARAERCHGEIRGPVMWSETISARSATAGDEGLVVCAIPRRAYDTPENRVLAAALRSIVDAGRVIERGQLADAELSHHALRVAGQAKRYLDHRTLGSVATNRLAARELSRARAGRKSRSYQRAFAVLDRRETIDSTDVAALADPRTAGQHALLADLADELTVRGLAPGPFEMRAQTVAAGPIVYRNDRHFLPRHPHGVQLGAVLLDVAIAPDGAAMDPVAAAAELAARGHDGPTMVVTGTADLDAVLGLAGF